MERRYEYVVRIDGKEVWRGKNLKEKVAEIRKKEPKKKISIAWESDDDLLVCNGIENRCL